MSEVLHPTPIPPPPTDAAAPDAVSPKGRPITSPMSPVRRPERGRGFAVKVDGLGELGCADVRGFREASVAAVDPRAAAPQRLLIVAPEPALAAFLAAWAEDADQVRRAVTITRRFDARSIDAVATICSFGHGVETQLAVESVSARRGAQDREILRSGVHLKVDVEAALARYDAEAARNAETRNDREALAELELAFIDFD